MLFVRGSLFFYYWNFQRRLGGLEPKKLSTVEHNECSLVSFSLGLSVRSALSLFSRVKPIFAECGNKIFKRPTDKNVCGFLAAALYLVALFLSHSSNN